MSEYENIFNVERFPEEQRVIESVADFIDEEVDNGQFTTPVGSDAEEEGNECVNYIKGSGELRLLQVFDTLEGFKQAVVDYVLKEGWNVKFSRWGKEKSEAICAKGGSCPWKIYCSYEKHVGKWMVKTFFANHSCIKDGYSRVLTQEVIARLFLNEVRNDPWLKPKYIQDQIEQKYSLVASIDQCKKAKTRASNMILEEHNEQFCRLKDYRLELLDSNPGSSVELDTVMRDGEVEVFYRFYICFEALRKTWIEHCRPIIGLDGCFLKCTTKGQLLAAVGRDSNNQMYPVAWAVVDVEDIDNWTWFIERLQRDLQLGDGEGVAIISDRQKGLLIAVERIIPKVEHRMCARHIYGNLKRIHPNKPNMKGLFWKVAKAFNMSRYERRIEAVKKYDIQVYEDMMMKNPKNCSNAFFKPDFCCEDVHNNISESFNNAIDSARTMPLVEMLETIRRRTMVRIDLRRVKAEKHMGSFSEKAQQTIAEEYEKVKCCQAYPGANGWYEVVEKGSGFRVNMRRHTCSCRMWEMRGIPCRHALKVITIKKLDIDNYISDWFRTSKWRQIYSESISPVNGLKFWSKSGETQLLPPEIDVNMGRNLIPKRKKAKHESPTKNKTKALRKKRIMHCRKCKQAGHTAKKCPNDAMS